MGPDATEFKWRAGGEGKNPHRLAVSQDEKDRIKQSLAAYAEEPGVPLDVCGAVKIALRYGNYWVTWAGGVSIWTNPQPSPQPLPLSGTVGVRPPMLAATCITRGCENLCLPYCERCKELQRFAPRSPRSRSPG